MHLFDVFQNGTKALVVGDGGVRHALINNAEWAPLSEPVFFIV